MHRPVNPTRVDAARRRLHGAAHDSVFDSEHDARAGLATHSGLAQPLRSCDDAGALVAPPTTLAESGEDIVTLAPQTAAVRLDRGDLGVLLGARTTPSGAGAVESRHHGR